MASSEKYAHGGTQPIGGIAPLSLPYGCAIDQKNGDLAVTQFDENTSAGEVTVFPNTKYPGTTYTDSNFDQIEFAAYDDKGNFFVDGLSKTSTFHYAYLAAGGSSLIDLPLNTPDGQPGGVPWDGKYIAVGDFDGDILRTKYAQIYSIVKLANATVGFGFTKHHTQVVGFAAFSGISNRIYIYDYPAGGSPIKTKNAAKKYFYDAAMSIAP